jgi:hypothetical protein
MLVGIGRPLTHHANPHPHPVNLWGERIGVRWSTRLFVEGRRGKKRGKKRRKKEKRLKESESG